MNHADLLDRLLNQIGQRGLSIARGSKPGELLLLGPNAEKTPAVMEALKAFKSQLLKRFDSEPVAIPKPTADPEPSRAAVNCSVCGKDVTDHETRAFVADPLGCDRGGAMEVTDGNGVFHPAEGRCPYKP